MKTLLEKFVEKAVLPGERSEERAKSESDSLSLAALNLFGVERTAKERLNRTSEQVRADAKFSQQGWKRLSLKPLGWTKGLVTIKPAFSIFRIDDSRMTIQGSSFERPRLLPEPIKAAYLPAIEITTRYWDTTFKGVIPQATKETILKAAPFFTTNSDGYNDMPHVYLLCEEDWGKNDKPQKFIVVGWDGTDLWLIDDYVEPLSFEKFMDFEFPDLSKTPTHLSLPEYNPYSGGNE